MPIVYAGANDGVVSNTDNVDWATTRDAASGDSYNTVSAIIAPAFGSEGTGIGAAGSYMVARCFYQFDVSAITSALESAVLNIYVGSGTGDIRIVKMGGNFTSLTWSNFSDIKGLTAGATMAGNVQDYVDSVHTTTSAYQTITLNAQARADILAGGFGGDFNICIVGNTYDYLNVDPGAGGSNTGGFVFNNFPGTSFDCFLEYEYAAASSKSALAGSDFTRTQLRDRTPITTGLTENTLYEVVAVNDSPNQVYLTMEGDDLFRKPGETGKGFYIETTNSVSGSNVINYIQENPHASFILAGASSSSFLISSSVGTGERVGNTISVMATNGLYYSTLDPTTSGSVGGVNVAIFDLT